MNSAVLVGNLCKDVELKQTPSGVSCCQFTVACQRRFANKDGNREADFINCVAWRQTAEFVAKYFRKGDRIGLQGSIMTRSYEAQDGTKRYVTEVVAENVEFAGQKREAAPLPEEPYAPAAQQPKDGQTGFTEVEDDELPF